MTTYDTTPLEVLSELLRDRTETLQRTTLSDLTAAYLQWLDQARRDRLPLNAEFAYIAATLIQWKSRQLLHDPDEESPEVVELLEKLRTEDSRRGADALRTRLEKPSYWRQVTSDDITPTEVEKTTVEDMTTVVEKATVAELISTLEQALRNIDTRPVAIDQDPITTEEMLAWMRHRLQSEVRLDLQRLIEDRPQDRPAVFLTALELARTGDLRIHQQQPFETCWLDPA